MGRQAGARVYKTVKKWRLVIKPLKAFTQKTNIYHCVKNKLGGWQAKMKERRQTVVAFQAKDDSGLD